MQTIDASNGCFTVQTYHTSRAIEGDVERNTHVRGLFALLILFFLLLYHIYPPRYLGIRTSMNQAEALRKELAMVKDKAKVYISRLNEVSVPTTAV